MSTDAKIISHYGGQRTPIRPAASSDTTARGANDRPLKLYDGFWDQLVNEQNNQTSSRSV